MSEDALAQMHAELGDSMDAPTFEQILEMDDDEDREFSTSIVYGFFEQCENSFEKIQECLDNKDLPALSDFGHFLKGSSATLGLTNIKNSCEKIQHWGKQLDETGARPLDRDSCLRNIEKEFDMLKVEYAMAERSLRKFFGSSGQ